MCVSSMPQVIFIQMMRGHCSPITCNEARIFSEARILVLMFIHDMHGYATITQYDHVVGKQPDLYEASNV
jgi:hypothetical protein